MTQEVLSLRSTYLTTFGSSFLVGDADELTIEIDSFISVPTKGGRNA